MNLYALDNNYNVVNAYAYAWTPREQKTTGKISASIFPFNISLKKSTSRYIKPYPTMPKGFVWIIINIVFVVCQIGLIKKRQTKLANQILDLILVAFTGIFGFIAVNAFPNKLD